MGFIVVAIVVGLVIGLVRGGSVRHLADVTFRWWPVLAVGVGLQAMSSFVRGGTGIALLIASFGLLLAFAGANIQFAGFGVVVIGIALNVVTITVNEGMPVRAEAIVAAGIAEWSEVPDLNYGTKRHLERPDDQLMVISDIIPVPGLKQVLSFGDIVLSVGVADLIMHLLRPRRRPRGLRTEFTQEASAQPGNG